MTAPLLGVPAPVASLHADLPKGGVTPRRAAVSWTLSPSLKSAAGRLGLEGMVGGSASGRSRRRMRVATKGKAATESVIGQRFSRFEGDMKDLWERYSLITFYLPYVHTLVKSGALPPMRIVPFAQPTNPRHRSADATYGIIDATTTVGEPRQTLVEAIGRFERYMGHLAHMVYYDFAESRLAADGGIESTDRSQKLISIVLTSSSRHEIVDRIVEEKVRAISYGSMEDLFVKNRYNLGFGNHFVDAHRDDLTLYARCAALRNIIVHNDGRVDRRFLRDVANSGFRIGARPMITSPDLIQAIAMLVRLGLCAAVQVIYGTYHGTPKGEMLRRFRALHP